MNWRFLPFKSLCQQNGKATRKKLDLNLKNFNYFPPEGHTYVDISHTDKEIASTSDEVTVKSYLFFGGSRRTNETAWGYGKEFFLMKFSVEDTDINLGCKYHAQLKKHLHLTKLTTITYGRKQSKRK